MRRSTRQRLVRWVMYAIFVIAVVLVIVSADWARLQQQFFDPALAAEQFPEIITIALKNTLLFTVIAFAGGLVLGVLMALMKLSSIGPYRWFATAYIELFRGLPALLTIFAFAFILPIAFGVRLPGGAVGAGLLGLVAVASA